jgi:hypothetical protein
MNETMELNVKDHVNNDQKVVFQFYRSNILYYKTEKGLVFEVPISDCGDACFNNEDKAILYMRWIRKQIEAIKAEQNAKSKDLV